jgi:hypothetical protein
VVQMQEVWGFKVGFIRNEGCRRSSGASKSHATAIGHPQPMTFRNNFSIVGLMAIGTRNSTACLQCHHQASNVSVREKSKGNVHVGGLPLSDYLMRLYVRPKPVRKNDGIYWTPVAAGTTASSSLPVYLYSPIKTGRRRQCSRPDVPS